MTTEAFPPIDITAQWGRLNDTIIALVDYVPDDKMDWSPREGLWGFKGILLHTVMARDGWMADGARDGEEAPNVLEVALAADAIKEQLRRSWERVQRFLSDPAKLSKEYSRTRAGEEYRFSGHWMAFHLLEHDIHHRADIFHYLALLGIEHPEIGTP